MNSKNSDESPDSTGLPDVCTTQRKESKVPLVKVLRFSPKAVKIVVLVIALCATVILFSAAIVFHYVSVSWL